MLALQHPAEVHEGDSDVVRTRALVDQLGAGLSRALLEATPSTVRLLADRAAQAQAIVVRRQARLGERPVLDEAASSAVSVAATRYRDACRDRSAVADARQRLMMIGNAAGLGSIAFGVALTTLGLQPMSAPVAFAVLAAAVGPVTAAVLATSRSAAADRAIGAARLQWADALDKVGLPTMGALAARRVSVAAWDRLRQEVTVAEEAARPHLRAWQRLAGPGVEPGDVDAVVARVDALRHAQLCLLALLLERRLGSAEQFVPQAAFAGESCGPTPLPRPKDEAEVAGSWLDDAFDRIRGRRLRIWSAR